MKHSRKHLRRYQGKLFDAQTFEVQVQRWPRRSDNQLMLVAQGTSPIQLSHAQRPTSQVLLQGLRKMSLSPHKDS